MTMSRGDLVSLSALKAHLGVQSLAHILHQRLNALALSDQVVEHALELEGLGAEVATQHEVMEIEHLAQPRGKPIALTPCARSRARSMAMWVGRISAQLGLTTRRS